MMRRDLNIGMVGGGSWATAVVKMLTDNVREKNIFWWMRNGDAIDYIQKNHHNPHYLSAVELSASLNLSNDIQTVMGKSDIIVLNVPAAFLKKVLKPVPIEAFENKIIVSAIKGIVPDENQIIAEYLHGAYAVPFDKIAVISGPCHAEEVSQEKLSYLTIASSSNETATLVSSVLSTRYIHTAVSDDIYGTEYAAVLKNIYAVASGICHGVGFGDNFQAVLISNAIREMARFVNAVHPISRDIKESAYLGDLLVTAYSQFSRNRTFGNMIGKGYAVRSAQLEMNMIAEGYFASKSIHEINRQYDVDMPICRAVYAILYEQQSPFTAMQLLTEQLS